MGTEKKSHKKAFVSKMAALTLAFGIAASGSPVFAQDTTIDASPDTNIAPVSETVTLPKANETGVQTVVENVRQAVEQDQQQQLTTTNWSVEFDPMLPLGVIGGAGGLAVLLALYAASRRTRGSLLYLGAASMITLALANPQILKEDREMLPTEVVVVVDKSQSQTINGRMETTEETRKALLAKLESMQGINIRVVEVDSTKNGVGVDGTNLFKTLDENLTDVPYDRLGAVIMLTDGIVHDVPEKYTRLGAGVPLHVLVSGQTNEFDRRIVIDAPPRFGLVGEDQTIKFRVLDEGTVPDAAKGQQVLVTLSSDGTKLASKYVTPGDVVEMKVNIPHAGKNIVEIQTEAFAGEITDINNRVVTTIEGIREKLNVLLVSGEPNAGARMWRELVKSDPDTNLVHFTILRPPEKQDNTPNDELSLIPFPVQELFLQKLDQFDLIIFDNYQYRNLLSYFYFDRIATYVENGGALLVASGPHYASPRSIFRTPLERILPAQPLGTVTEAPFVPSVNNTGERHPVTRGLSIPGHPSSEWGKWFRIIDSTALEGHTIMEGPDNKPLLILDREGKGRVAMLMSDNAWLWERGYEGGGPQAELLRRTSHWLMKKPDLEEEALRMTQHDNELIIEQQTMGDESIPVKVITPSGKEIEVLPEKAAPGIWRATVPVDEVGLYRAEQGGEHAATTFANIGPANPKEFVQTLSTEEIMKQVAEQTGGQVTRMADNAGKLDLPSISPRSSSDDTMQGSGWMGIKMTDASILKGVNRTGIPPWLSFLTIVGFLAGAYYRSGEGSLFKKKEKTATEVKPEATPTAPKPAGPSMG